jgi:BTB/POZ domain
MVEVVVGDEAAVWCLHKTILAAGSTFFKAAMNSPFKEGSECKITLANDDNLVFQLLVQYLYTRRFHTNSMRLLLKAYVLGDKLGAPGFQAHALDKIFDLNCCCCRFTAEQVLWVFQNTLPRCGLQRLTADAVAHETLRQKLKYGKEDWGMLAPIVPQLMEGIISSAGVQDAKEQWSRKCRLAYQD